MKSTFITNRRILSLLFAVIIIIPHYLSAQPWALQAEKMKNASFLEAQYEFNNYWKDKTPSKGTGWKQFKRLEWFLEQRLYPDNELPDLSRIYNDYQNYNEKSKSNNSTLNDLYKWTALGPFVKPKQHAEFSPTGLGRMNCISFHPTNSNVIWAGASFGGVWKTTNGGGTWQTFPFTQFLSIGISDIACAPSNPNVVYAATGDANAAGVLGALFNYSIGIIKTTDNGNTWALTEPLFGQKIEIASKILINRILVHPQNENIVYVGSSVGLFKTTDGGNTWTTLNSTFCRDLEFKADNPDYLVGAFREISGNAYLYSIAKVNNETGALSKKIQFNDVIRISLNVTKGDPKVMYALCASYDMGFHSVIKSTDAGETWTTRAKRGTHPNYLHFYTSGSGVGGQGLYDLCLAIDPKNSNIVYIGGVNVWKSTDGGAEFTINTDWQGLSAPWIHADVHSLEFSPDGNLFACTDGGVNKTTNGGTSWSDLSNSLAVTQFYKFDQFPDDENFVIGGTQDNGTHLKNGASWTNILGSDGMDCKIDYTNKQYLYASMYNGSFWRSTNGGNSFFYMIDDRTTMESGAWVSPMAMDPRDPKILYIGHHNLWKSTNRGSQWQKINVPSESNELRSIALSESQASTIYCATINKLFATHDGGANWTTLMTTSAAISDIVVDPNNHQRCWVTLSGYSNGYKVIELNGTSQKNISGSLPNVPVNTITYQKNSPDRLYLGTDLGVFYTDKNLNDWIQLSNGLPNVVVADIKIHYKSGKLRAATYARGLWETTLNNCNLPQPKVTVVGETAFCQGESCVLVAPDGFESYIWNSGGTTKSIIVNQRGNYYVTVTDAQGCVSSSENITVTVYNVPDMKISTASAFPSCDGEPVRLRATIGFKEYYWSNGGSAVTTDVTEPGTITVRGVTSNGCESISEPFEVYFKPSPEKPSIYIQNTTLKTDATAVAYLWYLNGSPIQGATDKTHIPVAEGYYQVAVFNENNCSKLSDEYFFTTSVEDIFTDDKFIIISPNPSDGVFNIEISSSICDKIILDVSNILGNKILTKQINVDGKQNRNVIDLKLLPNGVYFARFICGDKLYVHKLIKK